MHLIVKNGFDKRKIDFCELIIFNYMEIKQILWMHWLLNQLFLQCLPHSRSLQVPLRLFSLIWFIH